MVARLPFYAPLLLQKQNIIPELVSGSSTLAVTPLSNKAYPPKPRVRPKNAKI